MSIVNLHTQGVLEAQFNPTELTESLGAKYADEVVPGLSHPVRQFVHTESQVLDVNLYFDSISAGKAQHARNSEARKFLMAACFPRRMASNLRSAGAPRLLFVWPGLISLTCTLDKLKFGYTLMNTDAAPTVFTASCTLTEIRDTLLTCEDVLNMGSERTGLAF
jgi:hypothetical protein